MRAPGTAGHVLSDLLAWAQERTDQHPTVKLSIEQIAARTGVGTATTLRRHFTNSSASHRIDLPADLLPRA